VQYTEQLAGLHRHTMNHHIQPTQLALGLIPGGIARLAPGPQQATTGTEPVDHDDDLQARPIGLGLVQGIEHLLAGLVLLQVQGNDHDSPGRRGDAFQQAGAVGRGIRQHLDRFGGDGEAWQRRQHGVRVQIESPLVCNQVRAGGHVYCSSRHRVKPKTLT